MPRCRELELLAQRARIQLEPPANLIGSSRAGATSLAASLGLTPREAEVLVLVAAGRTNRQIGQELFITPKTAGVHGLRILAKLRVAGRGKRPQSRTGSASTGNDPPRRDSSSGRV
jgi:DNA-binding CsgD family transcriptional regulator